MSKRSDKDLIEDILICLSKIQSYIEGISFEDFKEDSKTQDAVVRNLEVIGEATKLLSKEIKAQFPAIPWKMIAGTRDKLIHDYFGINIDIVWAIASQDVPNLILDFNKIKEEFGGNFEIH